jgi:putative colanic acid biosynthesis glycosyltransferase
MNNGTNGTGVEPPLFSLITVTMNDRAGLERTARSVAAQSLTDYEWLVVDGGSTDGTREFLPGIGNPRLVWSSELDRGIYDAMNKGTNRARGRYVVYLNGGDELADPETLDRVRACLVGEHWPDVLYAAAVLRFSNGRKLPRPPRPVASAIRHGLPAIHQSTYFRREFLDVPPYDLSYRVNSDYYISARCYVRGARIAYLKAPTAIFAIGGISLRQSSRGLVECWRLQRDVLRLGLPPRILSASRRYLTCLLVRLLQLLKHAS